MTSGQPLVSIVTPVYNEEQHLAECIESVIAQTYENWEYVIVDNCSTDASAEIARRYAEQDSRIRFHQNSQFLHALQNHNAALQQLSDTSKYCKVVLADDWIYPECLERMVSVGEMFPSVGIVGAFALEGQQVVLTGLPYSTAFVRGRDACRAHLLKRQYVFGTPSSVLYRAELVRNRVPFYNVSNVHADTEVCFALLKCSDFGFVHQVLTYTRVRAGSLNAKSMALQTAWAAKLRLLVTYGSTFLTHSELNDALQQHESQYYEFLGKSVLLRRNREFWNYHRGQMAELGMAFSRLRLAEGVLRALTSPVLSLMRRARRRLGRSGDHSD